MTITTKRTHLLRPLLLAVLVAVLAAPGIRAAQDRLFILKGDLHCHSAFSHDCEVPVEQVIADSIIAGYDFIALTEHNTTAHLRDDHSSDKLLVIAGYELTTPAAHVNIFGLRSIPRKSAIYDKEEMNEHLATLRERGGLFQLDHPNCETYYSRFGYDADVDFLEILNGVFREDDRKTLNDWQAMLCAGRRLVATGGTDAHKNHKVRKVFNNVLVAARTEEAILEGLKAGRNFVTVQADGPIISLNCGDIIMGGVAAYEEGQAIAISIGKMVPGITVKVYTSNGLEAVERYTGSIGGTYEKQVPTEGISFCRVELWFDDGNICAYSNPIYIQQ